MMECLCLNCCLLYWPLLWVIALVTTREQTALSVSFQASLWPGRGGKIHNRVCTQACKVTWHLQSESQGSILMALYWCSYVQGCKSFAHQIDLCCRMWEALICFIVLVFILSVLDIDYQNQETLLIIFFLTYDQWRWHTDCVVKTWRSGDLWDDSAFSVDSNLNFFYYFRIHNACKLVHHKFCTTSLSLVQTYN